jgi:hypothetical protein
VNIWAIKAKWLATVSFHVQGVLDSSIWFTTTVSDVYRRVESATKRKTPTAGIEDPAGTTNSKKVWQMTDASIRINSPQMQQSPESFLPLQYLPSAF